MSWFKKLFSKAPPAPEPSPVTAIPDRLLPHERTCWDPIVQDGPEKITGSKFGGLAALGPEEEWPVCGNCGQAMQLFAQLNSEDLPEEIGRPFGDGLLQLFYCTSPEPLCEVDAEGWAPFGASSLARVQPSNLETRSLDQSPVAEAFPARNITGWQPERDFPNWEERGELGISLSDPEDDYLEQEGLPRFEDKLGGWPAWVQGVEYPSCPDCGKRMEVLLQIDSEDNLPYMFGDVGRGHLFYCRDHPSRLGFGWACP